MSGLKCRTEKQQLIVAREKVVTGVRDNAIHGFALDLVLESDATLPR